ncbi:hypothetical protein [Clostridium sp.]|nr:hypothetical protein [Clostridium sp.]MDU6519373.1 hypothetical protein [Clostridium sp.]
MGEKDSNKKKHGTTTREFEMKIITSESSRKVDLKKANKKNNKSK